MVSMKSRSFQFRPKNKDSRSSRASNKISGPILRAIPERFVQCLDPKKENGSGADPSACIQCAIQNCLQKNGFNEAKCTKLVDALYECCQAFYEKNGDGATTVSCPKANLLRLKIEQRKGIQ